MFRSALFKCSFSISAGKQSEILAGVGAIGDVEVTIGNLMGAQAQMWTGNLTYKTSDNRGKLIVRTEAIQDSN